MRVPIGTEDKWRRRAVRRRVAEQQAQRSIRLGIGKPELRDGSVEIKVALFHALHQQRRGEDFAHVADEVRRVRRGADARVDVRESETLRPRDRAIANQYARHPRYTGLLTERFQ